MIRLFTNRISFVWNLLVIYMYNFYDRITTRHIQESVVLFDNIHTTDSHTIIDFILDGEILSIIVKNPRDFSKFDILSVYDNNHNKDLTRQFKRFAHYYNSDTKSFDNLDLIKSFLNTSDNIVIIDDKLDEYRL